MARARSRRVDEAIVSSALAIIAERGVEGFSVEEVASRAAVAKATIYRRYSDRQDLISSALATLSDHPPAINRKHSTTTALIETLEWVRTSRTTGGDLLPQILTRTNANAELFGLCHERVLHPRWQRVHDLLTRGVERGELRSDVDVDVACSMLVSPVLMFNMMARHQDQAPTKDFVARLVRQVLAGIAVVVPASVDEVPVPKEKKSKSIRPRRFREPKEHKESVDSGADHHNGPGERQVTILPMPEPQPVG
ncbi:MAG: TetR/AcrR family transcriptional regulator [Actinomycetes bacterium]